MRNTVELLGYYGNEHAQKEIREIAQKMLDLVKDIEENPFQHTLNSWGY